MTHATITDARKCYSLDDESFNIDSLGDLIDALRSNDRLRVGETYYEADCRLMEASDVVDVDGILDRMDEVLYQEVGEVADPDFIDTPGTAKAELQSLVEAWVDKHVNVGRYWKIVGATRPMKITQEDIDA